MGTRRLTMDGTLGDTADEERNTSDSETVIGGEVWDLARRLVVSPFPLALISSGVLFGLLLLAAVFAVLRLYCAGYENSTPRSSLASTDLDSVEWGMPSGGFFRQRTSYPESIEKRKSSGDSNTIPTPIKKAEKHSEQPISSSRATQTEPSQPHQGIRSRDLCVLVTNRCDY